MTLAHLCALLGQPLERSGSYHDLGPVSIDDDIDEIDPTDARVYARTCDRSVEFILDVGHRVRTIFVYPLRRPGLLAGLFPGMPFEPSPLDLIRSIGEPSRTGAAVPQGLLGPTGAWFRFDREAYSLHFEYSFEGDGLHMITLMAPDFTP